MNIKERRLRVGLTQKKLAKMVGVKNCTISLWESGKTIPSKLHQYRLERVLGTEEENGNEQDLSR